MTNKRNKRVAHLAPEYFGSQLQAARMIVASTVVVDASSVYRRQTYQNRCRIRTPHGLLWLTVPLKRGGGRRPINEVLIDNSERWRVKHWRSLEFNYRSSPFFEYYEPFFADLFQESYTYLGEFTLAATKAVTRALELSSIPGKVIFGTDGDPAPDIFSSESSLVLTNAAQVVGAGELSPNVDLDRPFPTNPPASFGQSYRQNFPGFEKGTSIVDLMFNVGPDCFDRLSTWYLNLTNP